MSDEISKVAQRYIDSFNVAPARNPSGSTTLSHLMWMLYEVKKEEMSDTKRSRWLGFVQGCLVKDGIISIQKERDETRGIFNGK